MKNNKDLLKGVKNILAKNKPTLIFSVITAVSLLATLLSLADSNLGIQYIGKIAGLFSPMIWIALTLSLAISATLSYYEKYALAFIPLMVWLLVTVSVIRTSNIDLLKNAATGEPVLGPDLDPFLFLRKAMEISEGRLPIIDTMRAAPLGVYNQYVYKNIMPWSIFLVHKISSIFGNDSVTYSAIISPVIFFVASIVAFFGFVFFLFRFRFSRNESLATASIASILYSFAPSLLPRTVAGIPELESLGMLWLWLSFLFFTLAWRQEKIKKAILFGALSGLFTGAMSWTWGGYRYIYFVVVASSLLVFLFEKEKYKNRAIFLSWFVLAIVLELLKTNPGDYLSVLTSVVGPGLAVGTALFMGVYYALFNTNLKKRLDLSKIRLPKTILAILISIFLGILFLLIVDPAKIAEIISNFVGRFYAPFTGGRVDLTVAENRLPSFNEIVGTFGYIFWLFFAGIILLFYEAVKHFDYKKRLSLNAFFLFFLLTFTFSKLSSNSILNGESALSKILYVGGFATFILFLVYVYIRAYAKDDEKTLSDFTKIGLFYIILISLSFFGLMFLRAAIRFFLLAAPILVIMASYLIIQLSSYSANLKDKTLKTLALAALVLSILLLIGSGMPQAQATIDSAKTISPSPYNQQWHHAMNWVSENTPENAIFAHWWDYGYWVQTLGMRATIADGGHPAGFDRNHFIGRYLLTTPNPDTALSFMKTLQVSHLLLDSTDIGKYSAFSIIGSDKTGTDRFSWISTFAINPNQIQETKNETIILYQGGSPLDEDIVWGGELFPRQIAGVGGFLLHLDNQNNQVNKVEMVIVYQGRQKAIPLRYAFLGGQIVDFSRNSDEEFLNSMFYVIPSWTGSNVNPIGVGLYLSNKTLDGTFVQLYLLEDSFDRYGTLELVHEEDDSIVSSLKSQGAPVDDFIYLQGSGVRGPIKIWSVDYPEGTPTHPEYLEEYGVQSNNLWGDLDYLGK